MYRCGSHLTDFRETPNLFKIGQKYWALYVKTYIRFIDVGDVN